LRAPAANTWPLPALATASRESSVGVLPGLGLATTAQAVPLNCSVRVWIAPLSCWVWPTAQTSLALTALMAFVVEGPDRPAVSRAGQRDAGELVVRHLAGLLVHRGQRLPGAPRRRGHRCRPGGGEQAGGGTQA
jgi:hypothetical protein